MLSKWPIRYKLILGFWLLLAVVATLTGAGLYGFYAYRSLVKSLSWRSSELPLAAQMNRRVADMQVTLAQIRQWQQIRPMQEIDQAAALAGQFADEVEATRETFQAYREKLAQKVRDDSQIADNRPEWQTVHKIEATLAEVERTIGADHGMGQATTLRRVDEQLAELQTLGADLPSHLHRTIGGFAAGVRTQYRTLIVGAWVASIAAALIFLLFIRLSVQWVLRPLRTLIRGSRRVAAGQFDYRITVDAEDEMGELARAMNDMTTRFRAIRDDLDQQVRQRTKQVIRNEQLASVGFLAAGVAHEINNPLASIAMCSESLQGRVGELLDEKFIASDDPRHAVIADYLAMIHSEAFRCKEITEKLLDFSRTGPVTRQRVDLRGLMVEVIEMVSHLGRYQQKNVDLADGEPLVATINPQEIRQVVLNLLTNALDSLDAGGTVRIELARRGEAAQLIFTDDGCGMDADVLEHLFEPFFTRRRSGQPSGQGTGLGLSISYRIVADHGGEIEASSSGPGQGATFRVRLPLEIEPRESRNQYQAA